MANNSDSSDLGCQEMGKRGNAFTGGCLEVSAVLYHFARTVCNLALRQRRQALLISVAKLKRL